MSNLSVIVDRHAAASYLPTKFKLNAILLYISRSYKPVFRQARRHFCHRLVTIRYTLAAVTDASEAACCRSLIMHAATLLIR